MERVRDFDSCPEATPSRLAPITVLSRIQDIESAMSRTTLRSLPDASHLMGTFGDKDGLRASLVSAGTQVVTAETRDALYRTSLQAPLTAFLTGIGDHANNVTNLEFYRELSELWHAGSKFLYSLHNLPASEVNMREVAFTERLAKVKGMIRPTRDCSANMEEG